MLRRICWLCLLICLACGETAKSSMGPAGGTSPATATGGSPTQAAGGSAGASNGGAISGGSATSGTNATSGGSSEAGSTGVGGALTVPCGGDVTATWAASQPGASNGRPSNVDACFNVSLTRNPDGSLGSKKGIAINAAAAPLFAILTFKPPAMADPPAMAEAFYTLLELRKGTVVQDYADACLSDGVGKATCAELSDLLTSEGLGQGSALNVACAAGASGGCSCSFAVSEVAGPVGLWSVDPQDATELVFKQPTGIDTYQSFKVPYCVDSAGLHFGVELAQVWTFVPAFSFAKVDCTDGIQGPGEDGPDCGLGCTTACQ